MTDERTHLLAQLVRQGRASREIVDAGLRLLRAGDSAGAARVVLIHPVGGGLLCYRELVAAIPGFVSVWGIEAKVDALEQVADQPLGALAARYVDILGEGQIAAIGGWSHGGLIAWEAAHLLAEPHGTPAPPVVMLDTTWPAEGGVEPGQAELSALFAHDLARTNGLDPGDFTEAEDLISALGVDASLAAELQCVFELNSRAFMRHSPTPAPLDLTFVATEGTNIDQLDHLGARRIDLLHAHDCDHWNLLQDPNGIRVCAEAVERAVT